MEEKIGYKKTLELLFKNPLKFFSKIKEIPLLKIPFSYFLIIGLIVAYTLQKMDKLMNMYLLGINPIFLLGLVIILSLIGFAIHTSFYNFRVNKCGGKSETRQSEKLVLFSNIFLYFYISIYFIYFIFLFLGNFENISDKTIDIIDSLHIIFYTIFSLHAIYISYNGVKGLYIDLKESKTKFWFIFLPGFFTILLSGIVLFFT